MPKKAAPPAPDCQNRAERGKRVGEAPAARRSTIWDSSSGGTSEAATEATTHSSVAAVRNRCVTAATRTAANTPVLFLFFMQLTSCLAFVKATVSRLPGQQLAVRADKCFSILHKDHLLHLRKIIEPVRDQKNDLILCHALQIGKDDILRFPVQCRKGIV